MSGLVKGRFPAKREVLREELARAIAALKAEAKANRLTDADVDAELAAYNAERRERACKGSA